MIKDGMVDVFNGLENIDEQDTRKTACVHYAEILNRWDSGHRNASTMQWWNFDVK